MKIEVPILIVGLCCLIAHPSLAQHKPGAPRPHKSTKTVSALILDQKHVYLGKMKVLLTPDAMKMVCQGKFRFSLIAKAPKWDVVVFRTDDRLVCKQSLETFCDQGLFSNMVLQQKTRMLPPGTALSTGKISGFTVQRHLWTDVIFEYFPLKGNAAPQSESILHAAYKLPTNGQIPLTWDVKLTGKDWITNLSEVGIRRVFLGTEKIARAAVPVSEFDVPPDLTPEKSITRIVVGKPSKLKETGADVLFNLGK